MANVSPSESYWSQLDAQGVRNAVNMVNGMSVNGLGEVSMDTTQTLINNNLMASNLIALVDPQHLAGKNSNICFKKKSHFFIFHGKQELKKFKFFKMIFSSIMKCKCFLIRSIFYLYITLLMTKHIFVSIKTFLELYQIFISLIVSYFGIAFIFKPYFHMKENCKNAIIVLTLCLLILL